MDKYLEYLNKNLERTLGRKMTIGKISKIIGVKTEEEVAEMRAEGKKILDVKTDDGLRLGDITDGSLLYQTFEEFKEQLEEKGVDYDHMADAWFVWREERMADRLNTFEPAIREQLEVLVQETVDNFHNEDD